MSGKDMKSVRLSKVICFRNDIWMDLVCDVVSVLVFMD